MESYDQIVKKLIKIIQMKSDDKVKQLEDLWESLDKNSSYQNELKRSSPDSNFISNESENPSKKTKLKIISSNTTRSKSKPLNFDNVEKYSSNSLSTIGSNSEKSIELNDIFDDEMLNLDFNCFVCKSMNQERNNKLMECNRCSKLYHQKCHNPYIDETKNFSKLQEENKISWYIENCQSCSTIEDEDVIISQNGKNDLLGLSNKFVNSKLPRQNIKKNSKFSDDNQNNTFNLPPISVNGKK